MQKQQSSLSENPNLPDLIKKLSGKLFNEYVYIENYTKEKALKAISNCVGSHIFEVIINEYESDVIALLRSEKEQTY